MASALRLRRLFTACCCLAVAITGCFIGFEKTFVEHLELVAFFNFAKKSLFINFGLFNNGIYVP